MDTILRDLQVGDFLSAHGRDLAIMVGVTAAVLIAWRVVWPLVKRRRSAPPPRDLVIDVASLVPNGPPDVGPQVLVREVPVRLAVVIVAPLGRHGQLLPRQDLAALLEGIAPQLGQIFVIQQAQARFWPAQLSWQGFTSSLFTHLHLPGERGQGSPWNSVAGLCVLHGKRYCVGLVFCAAEKNQLSFLTLDGDDDPWRHVLRTKSAT